MVITESIELRPETQDSSWVSAYCVVCLDEVYLNPSTFARLRGALGWLTPATDYLEVYVDGDDTGFVVCDACCALPREALAAQLQDWVDDVIRGIGWPDELSEADDSADDER